MQNRMLKIGGPTVLGLTLVLGALWFLPVYAQTTTLAAGSVVAAGDGDMISTTQSTINTTNEELCYIDGDGDSTYDSGETVLFRKNAAAAVNVTCGSVGANDVILSATDFGKKTKVGVSPHNTPTLGLDADLAYYDADGNSVWSPGDTMYIRIDATGNVAVGDVRLTAYGTKAAGSTVTAGDGDLNLGVSETGTAQGTGARVMPASDVVGNACTVSSTGNGCFTYWDVNGDSSFNGDDPMYLDVDGASITVLDIRLTAFGTMAAGSIVAAGDSDSISSTSAAINTTNEELCYIDGDGDSTYDSGETVLFRKNAAAAANATCGSVGANDVILSGTDFGKKTRVGVSPHNTPTLGLDADLAYYDADGNSVWSPGDTMYIRIDATGNVAVGDVRLTAYGTKTAGSTVTAGDTDLNLGVSETGTAGGTSARVMPASDVVGTACVANSAGCFSFWDINGDASFNGDDPMYLDVDGTTSVTVLDIRLVAFGTMAAGSIVAAGDSDSRSTTSAAINTTNEELCYIDGDGDSTYDSGETVLFRKNAAAAANATCGSVGANDVILSGTDFGKKTRVGVSPHNTPTLGLDADLAYYDADGNSVWSPGDTMYIRIDATGNVAVGDVRLTAYGTKAAGSTVTAGDGDLNLGVSETGTAGGTSARVMPASDVVGTACAANSAGCFTYWDQNGDSSFNGDDPLYLDVDGTTSITVLDIRLTATSSTSAPTTTTTVSGETTTTSGGNVTTTTTTSQGPTTTTSGGPTTTPKEDETSTKQPGFEAVALLAGLGLAVSVIAWRRK